MCYSLVPPHVLQPDATSYATAWCHKCYSQASRDPACRLSSHPPLALDALLDDIVGDGGDGLGLDVLQGEPQAGGLEQALGANTLWQAAAQGAGRELSVAGQAGSRRGRQ